MVVHANSLLERPSVVVTRLGLLGGTFDPIHYGHLMIAEVIGEELSLDAVSFLPAGTPPHKGKHAISRNQHRLRMTELAVAGNPRFSVSTFDLTPTGPSYTVDLLDRFQAAHPHAELVFLMGADSLRDFSTWHDPDGILRRARLAVANRGGVVLDAGSLFAAIPGLGARTHLIPTPELRISATALRSRVQHGKSIRYLTPDAVSDYVREHRLYVSKTA